MQLVIFPRKLFKFISKPLKSSKEASCDVGEEDEEEDFVKRRGERLVEDAVENLEGRLL